MQVLSDAVFTRAPWGTQAFLRVLALGGMVLACGVLPVAEPTGDDAALDDLWLALRRGDLMGADAAAARIEDVLLSDRSRRDVLAARWGRSAALVGAWADDSWWAARYLASGEAARETLDQVGAERHTAAWALERSRRAGTVERRSAWARKALQGPKGSLEAWALLAESHLALQDWRALAELFEEAPGSARLADLENRFALGSGRRLAAMAGLLDDLEAGLVTPAGLELLGQLLLAVPEAEAEQRALASLEADSAPGQHWRRARSRLLAQLRARTGDLQGAQEAYAQLPWLELTEARQLSRWRQRQALQAGQPAVAQLSNAQPTPEEQIDGDPARLGAPALHQLRWFHEWDLAARQSYREALQGDDGELDEFLARLDAAAAPVGAAPALSPLPRQDFGLFGELLDVATLSETLGQVFVLGGEGFLLPAEITMYDRVSSRPVETDAGSYDEVSVRHLRVPGFVASQGAAFTGAGIVHTVFIDEERVAAEAGRMAALTLGPEPTAQRAFGRAERRALREPLDVVLRLRVAVSREAGAQLQELLRESLALHEGQHIIDVQEFLVMSSLGRLAELMSAGLLPGAVRAEVERRAQLRALRECSDPRLPLADLVAQLPVEGARAQSEHARGYAALLAEFIELLDTGDYEGAQELATWEIDPERVLVQQLHKLPSSVVRAVALAISD